MVVYIGESIVEKNGEKYRYKKGEITMEKILEILKSVRSDVDYETADKLIDDGILDSFDIVAVVGELCDAFDITITVDDLEPENFNSVAAIKELVDRLQDEF